MYKQFLTILFIYSTCSLFAQRELIKLDIKTPRPTEVEAARDPWGNFAYFFRANKKWQATFVNSSFDKAEDFKGTLSFTRKDELVESVLDDKMLTVYFLNKKQKKISVLSVDRKTGAKTEGTILTLDPKEELLAFQSQGDKVIFLSVIRNTSTLKIYFTRDNKNIEAQVYEIDYPALYSKLKSDNSNLNNDPLSDVGIEKVGNLLENNVKSSYPYKKLYFSDQYIYLTFDEPGQTHFIEIDINNKSSNYKKLAFTLDNTAKSHRQQGNSFIKDRKLFRATINPDLLNVSMIDIDSMTLLASYNISPDNEITIANTPLMYEGSDYNDGKILKKTSQYFGRVLNARLAIAVNALDSSRYEIEIGGYDEDQVYRGASGFGSPGISISIGGGFGGFGGYPMMYPGGFYSPMSWGGYPGYYPGAYATRIRVTYFKTLLNKETFEHIEGTPPMSLREKVSQYESNVFRKGSPELLLITPNYNQALVMGYYLKNANKYQLVEFGR
jgi:hypothetical protein